MRTLSRLVIVALVVIVGSSQLAASSADGSSFFGHFLKIYMPRQECMYHEAPVIWLHVIADLLIAVAYYSIPFALVYFVRRRKDVAFGSVFWMFAAFILACGTTHFIGVVDIWRPYYRLDGVVKALTAALSILTAVALWRLMPQLLAIPSAAALEEQVKQRTSELLKANQDRDRLLDAEREARAAAERANRLKDEFLANLSHELRTPLNAILGWAQVLQGSKNDATELGEGLKTIERNARSQTQLIAELLDVSRIVSGKLKVELEIVDLATIADAVLTAVAPSAAAKQITLERTFNARSARVNGDAARLQQVLSNLLTNSIKFTPSGGHVRIAIDTADDQAQVTISDDGQGISADFLPHMFERFRQSDGSTTRRHGGLGIGLSIVKSIIEAHGGTISATSPGVRLGASFTVRVPLASSASESETVKDAAGQAEDNPADGPCRGALHGVKVLVVDDEPDAVSLAARVLGDVQAQILTATSASAAIDLLKRERPDVLISDIGMPGIDGYQLIRNVRALATSEGGGIPAAAVTAFAGSDDRHRALAAGYQTHISKPYEPDKLVSTVAGLAGKAAR